MGEGEGRVEGRGRGGGGAEGRRLEVGIATVRRGTTPQCQEWCISYASGTSGCVTTHLHGSLIIILLLKKLLYKKPSVICKALSSRVVVLRSRKQPVPKNTRKNHELLTHRQQNSDDTIFHSDRFT
jgi:hypothetical protein